MNIVPIDTIVTIVTIIPITMDILQEIVAHKRIEVERFKQVLSEQEIHRRVETILDFSVPSMSKALKEAETGIIAEFRRSVRRMD